MEANSDKCLKKSTTRGRGRGKGGFGSKAKKSYKKITSRLNKNNKLKDVDEIEIEDEIESEETEQENDNQNHSSPIHSPELNKEDLESEITSTLSFVSASTRLNVPLHNNQPLQWDHRVNLMGEKCPNPRIHLCDKCNQPVLIYGRMIPCKHVFCYACAKANEEKCLRCNVKVLRIEKNGLGRVFMCSYESCRRTYLSQRDLQAHVQHRHLRRSSNANNGFSTTTSTLSSNQSNPNSLPSNHSHNIMTSPKPSSQSSPSSSSLVINRMKTHSSSKTSFQSIVPIVSSRCNLINVPSQEDLKISNPVSTNSNILSQNQLTSGQSLNHFTPPPPQPFLAHPRAHISWPALHHNTLSSTGHPPFSPPTLNPFSSPRFEGFPNVGTPNWPLHLPHPPFNRPFYP